MQLTVEGVRFAGMRAAVPPTRHSFMEDHSLFTEEEAKKLLDTTGVHTRHILPGHQCASDMCVCAAEDLLSGLDWDPASVGLIVYVSQDADYPLPATACLMQRRLGLPQTAGAFDMPLGCSGFVYAAAIAAQMMRGTDVQRALVLCGDTSSRHLVPDDRSTLPLFGDAGVAAALETHPDAKPMFGVFGTDGRGGPHIAIRAGGRRVSTIPQEQPPAEEERQRLFVESRLKLDGSAVFAFTLKVVPKLIADCLALAGLQQDDIELFVMHQANKFILEHLRKRSKIPPERYPIDMYEYGNTSSASIPLVICNRLGDAVSQGSHKTLMAGFGVGWSWAGLVCDLGPMETPRVIDIPADYPSLTLEPH